MHTALFIALALISQSKEDKVKSLVGVVDVGFKETGVGPLGGGTAGSPFVLQFEKSCKAAGIHVSELEAANARGGPIYELQCASMDDGKMRVACTARLLRDVSLDTAPTDKPRTVYAAVWTSPLIVAAFDRDRIGDLEKLTQTFVDAFMKDWTEANPVKKRK